MATTDLEICISALLLVGADEITSFDDASREAKLCKRLYENTKQKMLQTNNWGFSLAMVELSKTTLATTSAEYDFGYLYEYQLPTDFLRLIKKNTPTNDYTIVGDKLMTSDDEVQVLYQYDVSESEFPAYFTQAVIYEMTKLLASALLQDDTAIEIWSSLAARELVIAKNIDAQNTPSVEIDPSNFALTSVR